MGRSLASLAVAALLTPAAVSAQLPAPAASAADERRLSPEQVEAILAEAAAKRVASVKPVAPDVAPVADDVPGTPPQVHGEVGFGIGTSGYREAFGTAIYPLGEDGVAAISFDIVDWGNRRWPR